MDKHWSNFCTMSIVHFMAYPQCLKGEGPIAATVAKIAEDPFFTGIEIGWIKDPAERAGGQTDRGRGAHQGGLRRAVGAAGAAAQPEQPGRGGPRPRRGPGQEQHRRGRRARLRARRVPHRQGPRRRRPAGRTGRAAQIHPRALRLRAGARDRAHLRGVRPRRRQEVPDRPQRLRGRLRPRGAA